MILVLGQDGHGPGSKPREGLDAGYLQGYIYSPRHRAPGRGWDEREGFENAGMALFDPQAYLVGLPTDRTGRLGLWDYWQELTSEEDWRDVGAWPAPVRAMLQDQANLRFGRVVASAPALPAFQSYEAAILDSVASVAADWVGDRPGDLQLYVGITITDAALRSQGEQAGAEPALSDAMAQWLDRLTKRDFDGVYLLVDWQAPRPQVPLPDDPVVLSNLMYVVYSLAELNAKDVIVGYTDLSAVLVMAAGATGVGTGWRLGSRRLCVPKMRSRFGRQAVRRLWLREALAEVRQDQLGELLNETARQLPGASETVMQLASGTAIRHLADPTAEVLHNWGVLTGLAADIDGDNIPQRLTNARGIILGAREFIEEHVNRDQNNRGCFEHLSGWEEALGRFEALAGL